MTTDIIASGLLSPLQYYHSPAFSLYASFAWPVFIHQKAKKMHGANISGIFNHSLLPKTTSFLNVRRLKSAVSGKAAFETAPKALRSIFCGVNSMIPH
ncbi:MAG: hypothetical protein JSW33_00870 [bacterium]|nr:MAG: hypothetical protein JSW33_00870 [bacterium]